MNANAKKWVAALRSGKYKQGTGALMKKGMFPRRDQYCCLGVACDLYAKTGGKLETAVRFKRNFFNDYPKWFKIVFFNGNYAPLPEVVWKWLGLQTNVGEFNNAIPAPDSDLDYDSLTQLNDMARWSFKQIADFIETEPAGLFVPDGEGEAV